MQCLNLLRRQYHSERIGNDLQRPIAIMAKATSIKEALGRFEKEAGITAAETETVRRAWQSLGSTVANGLLNACLTAGGFDSSGPINREDGRQPEYSESLSVCTIQYLFHPLLFREEWHA